MNLHLAPAVYRRRQWLRLALAALVPALLGGCYADLDWREVRSADGRYSITLPARPHEDSRTVNTSAGQSTMHMNAAQAAGWMFAVSYTDYPAAALPRASLLIDEQRDAMVRNIAGKVVSEQVQPVAGQPGRRIVADGQMAQGRATLHLAYVMVGTRLYQVTAVGKSGDVPAAEIDTFVQSFKLGS